MAGPARFTTDDVSDVTVLRELEKIKKFIVGKTVTDFSITKQTETSITISISTNDKTWDITLPRGGVIPENLVYTNVDQIIESEKEFREHIAFNAADGVSLISENVGVKVEVESEEGEISQEGLIVEAQTGGVKISPYSDKPCKISFGEGMEVSDPYTESDNLTTKNGMIKVLREDVDNLMDDAEDKSNKVSVWSANPNDTHYPSEKLVYDNLKTTYAQVTQASVSGLTIGSITALRTGNMVQIRLVDVTTTRSVGPIDIATIDLPFDVFSAYNMFVLDNSTVRIELTDKKIRFGSSGAISSGQFSLVALKK